MLWFIPTTLQVSYGSARDPMSAPQGWQCLPGERGSRLELTAAIACC